MRAFVDIKSLYRHRLSGLVGRMVTGNIRERDQRVLFQTTDGLLWVAPEYLDLTRGPACNAGKKAPPVMWCPRCGITVFTHEDNVEGYCTGCDRARDRG